MSRELFKVQSKDKRVIYYDKPPNMATQSQHLSIAELEQKFGFRFGIGLRAYSNKVLKQIKQIQFQPKKSVDYADIIRQLDACLEHPFANLCIAKISDEVGCGLFATRDIAADTVLGIYSGLVVDEVDRYRGEDCDYLSMLGNGLVISAKGVSDMGRFMAHLPADPDRNLEKSLADFQDMTKLSKLLGVSECYLRQAIAARGVTLDQIRQIVLSGNQGDRELNSGLADMEFVDDEVAHSIAGANVKRELVPYKGGYVVALIAQLPIKKNEIVGFDYTLDYWDKKGCAPDLFSRFGGIVPHELYKRKNNVCVHVNTLADQKLVSVSNNRDRFYHDIDCDVPVYLGDKYGCASIYDIRQALVYANAVPDYYGQLPLNAIGTVIATKVAALVSAVSLFWQKPRGLDQEQESEAAISSENYAADVVCRAKDQASLLGLLGFFSSVHGLVKVHGGAHELVLQDVNNSDNFPVLQKLL